MEDEEYELVSREEVDRLKKEIEHLKSNPFVKNSTDENLYSSIKNLTDSVSKLYLLFENINKQLAKEYQSGISPEEKIDRILDQNKSIAEALVAFGSKLEALHESNQEVASNQEVGQLPNSQIDPFANTISQQNSFQPQMGNLPPLQPPAYVPRPLQTQNDLQNQMNINQSMNQGLTQRVNSGSLPQNLNEFKIDPNYPAPDRFQGLNGQVGFGEPIDAMPQKKRGLFGLKK
ncbi:MAG: hypothetical protein WC758_00830 [Candidatus Woesearchaeota archaeon]